MHSPYAFRATWASQLAQRYPQPQPSTALCTAYITDPHATNNLEGAPRQATRLPANPLPSALLKAFLYVQAAVSTFERHRLQHNTEAHGMDPVCDKQQPRST
jgi:hypothetical protein